MSCYEEKRWECIAKGLKNRTPKECCIVKLLITVDCWNYDIVPESFATFWSQDEDEKLWLLVKGKKLDWKDISRQINKTKVQCYFRWKDYLLNKYNSDSDVFELFYCSNEIKDDIPEPHDLQETDLIKEDL